VISFISFSPQFSNCGFSHIVAIALFCSQLSYIDVC
jgi:hypothetical protein